MISVCKEILQLRQEIQHENCIKHLSPEKILYQFNQLARKLTFDAKTWTLQLCSQYFSLLCLELIDAITEDKTVKIPNLTSLGTKTDKLIALQTVRDSDISN